MDVDAAHAHVLLFALVAVDVVITKNNTPSPGTVGVQKCEDFYSFFIHFAWKLVQIICWRSVFYGKLCIISFFVLKLLPVHTVSSSHDPPSPDQGSSTGVVKVAARFVLKRDLMKQHMTALKERKHTL